MNRELIPNLIKTISHPTRQKILKELKSGKKTAKNLENDIDCDIYNIYHHIKFLEDAGVVTSETISKEKYYSIDRDKIDALFFNLIEDAFSDFYSDDYEMLKIGIPNIPQVMEAVETKIQEIKTLVNSNDDADKSYLIFLKRNENIMGGKGMKHTLEEMVQEFVENGDLEDLDILSTLAYQGSGITIYRKNQSLVEENIKECAKHNLKLKYSMDESKSKLKIEILNNIYDKISFDDIETLKFTISSSAHELMKKEITERYSKLSDIDRAALKYIWEYLQLKIDVQNKGVTVNEQNGSELLEGIHIRTESYDKTDEKYITYFEITNFILNLEKSNSIYRSLKDGGNNNYKNKIENLSNCPSLGNLLVKLGVGYWVPWVTVAENRSYELAIPKFLYDIGVSVINSSTESPVDTAIPNEISPKLIEVEVPISYHEWGGFSIKGNVNDDFPKEEYEFTIESPSTKPYAANRSQQSRIYIKNWNELVNELGIKPNDWLLIEIVEPMFLYRIVKVLHKS